MVSPRGAAILGLEIIGAPLPGAVESAKKGSRMSQHAHHAIDVHSHYFPQSFLDLIEKHGPGHGFEYKIVDGKGPQFKHGHLVTGPVGPKFVDLDTRIQVMDEQGVEVHALSLSQPMVYWAPGSLAQRVSGPPGPRAQGGTKPKTTPFRRPTEPHPKRLIGLATLPIHEPTLALKE